MSEPIYDALMHPIREAEQLAQRARAWFDPPSTTEPYDDVDKPAAADPSSTKEEPPMSVIDDLKNILDKGEQDAAKVQRFESEPLVAGVLDMVEAVPEARGILELILGGIGKLASMAPAPAAPADPPPAPADPQIQTGIAV